MKVLGALHKQTLNITDWELLVLDNNSDIPLNTYLDLSWHPHGRVMTEPEPGLSYSRITGVKNSATPLVIFVDDDNILDSEYLRIAYSFYLSHPYVGTYGGRSLPIFESQPPEWHVKTGINLGCQDFGSEQFISDFASSGFRLSAYPEKAPIGTGMVIQKKAFMAYVEEIQKNSRRLEFGRKGKALTSGEDNDIVLTVVEKGFEVAYVPGLIVKHLIPAKRYSFAYLQKMAFEGNRSWVKVLLLHGICPWKKVDRWSYCIRILKGYIRNKAWQSPLAYIQWKASCGIFKGLSE